ncbi:MAG: hypothetical protein DME21_05550 [Verrucomicrobia bacterium]|nr:MAG: hypothetical protein DME21_05550 [Verrucomicrobiota bacterium]
MFSEKAKHPKTEFNFASFRRLKWPTMKGHLDATRNDFIRFPRKRHVFGSQDTDEAFTVSFGSSPRNPVDLSCLFLSKST